jgi:MFS family permease
VQTVGQLVVLRFVAGLFLAGVLPAAYAIATRVSDRDSRGGAHGITFSAVAMAMALGPLCGGPLGAVVGLRALYLFSGGMMLAALLRLVLLGRRIARQPVDERVSG